MKIGILTFHCAVNYGAVFQAYALQVVLMMDGYDVYVVDYCPDYLLAPYRPFKFQYNRHTPFMSNLKSFIHNCLQLYLYPARKKRNR